MEIKNLISFVQVAEMNGFTKAADALGYSQSTISFQIKQLETELGCLLFERINHTISLTDKGVELLKYAHKINALTEEFTENKSRKSKDKNTKGLKNTKGKSIKLEQLVILPADFCILIL